MKQIKLEKVIIDNFKSFKHYEHDFNLETEKISAHFGSGKTTIRKSLDFVLAAKVDDFRPCYFDNNEWKELEAIEPTSVTWFLNVRDENGIIVNYKLQVIADEKGTKYYVDDLKISTKTKYQEQLVNIFGVDNYETLILLTHLDNFLAQDWNKQREFLKKLTNSDKVLEKVKADPKYKDLKPYFDKGFGEVEIKKVLLKEKKDLESQKDKIIGAIRERENIINQYSSLDYNSLESQLKEIDKKVFDLSNSSIEKQLSEAKLKKSVNELNIAKLENKLKEIDDSKLECERLVQEYNISINKYKEIQEEIKYIQSKEVVYDDVESECPYCHSVIKPKTHEEQEIEFEEKQLSQVNELQQQLKKIDFEINDLNKQIEKISDDNSDSEQTIKLIKLELNNLKDANSLLDADIDYYSSLDNTQTIISLNEKKKDIILQLSGKKIVNDSKIALDELNKQRIDVLQNIQKNIQLEELRTQYSLDTMEIIEKHINSYFPNNLHWKLFSKLVTTGEYKEDLILISHGKRYDTACSNGEKIIAKVSTVLGLQKILNVNCFIFVDDFNDLGIEFDCSQQLVLLETKQGQDLDNIERF